MKKTPAEKAKDTKEKKAQEAEAKRIEGNIQRDLTNLMRAKLLYANPTRVFKLGDKVNILSSSLGNAEIIEVVEDLFYRVGFSGVENNYGKPVEYKSQKYFPWTQLIESETKCQETKFNTRSEMVDARISFHNAHLETLPHLYYFSGIDMNPSYQRGFVWNLEDKQKLIESIFQGVEIGKFALIRRPYQEEGPSFEILDGKQRLSTIIEFLQDRFAYKGVLYSQLNPQDKRYFEQFSITYGEAEEGTTLAQKLRYFLKLNTGGRAQDPQHMEGIRQQLMELEKKDK